MHGGEVREDWKALRKKKKRRRWSWSYRVSGVTWASLKASQQGVWGGGGAVGELEGGWVDRGRGVRDNWVPLQNPSVSFPAPVLLKGGGSGDDGSLKASQQEVCDCASVCVCVFVFFTYKCTDPRCRCMHAEKKYYNFARVRK